MTLTASAPVTIWGQERLIDKLRNQNIRLELTIDQFGLHITMIKGSSKTEATMRHAQSLPSMNWNDTTR